MPWFGSENRLSRHYDREIASDHSVPSPQYHLGGEPKPVSLASGTERPTAHKSGVPVSTIIRILLAIFLPPVAVLITTGIGLQFFLNIVLTILGIVPGMVHALWIIMRKD